MQITEITAKNFKGRSFNHALGSMTWIHGPNDSGKSAIADAVRLALLGHLPEIGKTNAATFTLCNAAKLTIQAKTSDGTIEREWASRGKSIKATESGVPDQEMPLVAMNAHEYFAASGQARIEMLFRLLRIDAEEYAPSKLAEAIAGKNGLVRDAIGVTNGSTTQQWIEETDATLAAKISEAKAEAKRFEGTIQGITQLTLNQAPVDPSRIAKEIEDAEKQLAEARKVVGRNEEKAKASSAAAVKRIEIETKLARLAAEIGAAPVELVDAKATEKTMNDLRDKRAKLKAEYDAAVKAYGRAQETEDRRAALERTIADGVRSEVELSHKQNALAATTDELDSTEAPNTEALQNKVTQLTIRIATLTEQQRGIDEQREATRARLNTMLQATACPTCGCAGEGWKAGLEERFVKAETDWTEQMTGISEQYGNAKSQHAEAQEALNQATEKVKQRQTLERKRGDLQAEIARAEAKVSLREGAKIALASLPQIPSEAPQVDPEIHEIDANILDYQNALDRAQKAAQHDAMRAELDAMPQENDKAEQNLYRAEIDVEALTDRLKELQTASKAASGQLSDKQRLAEAQEAMEAKRTEEKEFADARVALKAQREKLVDAMIKPLLEAASAFVYGILPTPLEYHDGELGRWNGSAWVPVEAFGGTFTAVTYAGIQAALASTAPSRILIVDELGRFDDRNKERFTMNVKKAIENGLIEQFIGIDVKLPNMAIEELTEIALTA